jgi:putative addiction module CopG family antidote
MDNLNLPPELERFAAEAIAAGRYRDMEELLLSGVSLLRRLEAKRSAFVASLQDAEAEADRVGCVSLAQADTSMRVAIRTAANRKA